MFVLRSSVCSMCLLMMFMCVLWLIRLDFGCLADWCFACWGFLFRLFVDLVVGVLCELRVVLGYALVFGLCID